MLRKLNELVGEPIAATDGEAGQLQGIYFDDLEWTVRHVVVNTGGGLSGRKVLIPPEAIRHGSPRSTLGVALTRREVMRSPGADSDMPLSRQYEEASAVFYGHSSRSEKSSGDELREAERRAGRSHLRDSGEVIGYSVQGLDGLIGHVADLVFDDESWRITVLLVDAREWLPGEKVRVSPEAVRALDWKTREVRLDLRREEVNWTR